MSDLKSPDDQLKGGRTIGLFDALGYIFFRGIFLFMVGFAVGSCPPWLFLGAFGLPFGPGDFATWIVSGAGLVVGTWVAALSWGATKKSVASRAA